MTTQKNHGARAGVFSSCVLISAIFVAGCAAQPTGDAAAKNIEKAKTPTEIVQQRANERLAALVAKNYDKAYEYLPPSYRALTSAEVFKNRYGGGVMWVDASVAKVDCGQSADRCEVMSKISWVAAARGATKPVVSPLEEVWIKEDGQWWFYQK